MNEYGLIAIKRRWCPEWLWWIACNPIPFWNDVMPYYRVSCRPLVWLLSCRDPRYIEETLRMHGHE